METKAQHIFIANRNPVRLKELKTLISDRFGSLFSIKIFNDNNSAINSIDANTKIVIFDNSIESDNKQTTLMTMKSTYPGIKSIMRTSNEDIEMAVDDYCRRKSFYLFRKGKTWERFSPYIYDFTNPIRLFIREFFVRKFLFVFFITFLVMGIGIYLVMNYTD